MHVHRETRLLGVKRGLQRPVLAEGALGADLVAAKHEEIAAFGLDALSVLGGSAKDPLGNATVAKHFVVGALPADVRHGGPDGFERGAHLAGARQSSPANLQACGSIEDDVVGHASHHGRAVVPIEGGEQIFEKAAPASIERLHVGFLLAKESVRAGRFAAHSQTDICRRAHLEPDRASSATRTGPA